MKVVVIALLLCIATLSLAAKEVHHASEVQPEVRSYWTREKFESAIPLDVLEVEGVPTPVSIDERLAQLVEAVAEPVFVDAVDSLLFPPMDDEYEEPVPASAQAKRAYPFPYSSGYAPSYTTDPWRRVGKVFFSKGGANYVCSAAVISKYVVATAGHCVFDAQSATKAYVTNFVFVPGYNNNNRPYGSWSAYQLFTSNDWASAAKFGRDYGFAVLRKNNNLGVGEVVGSLGYVVNLNPNGQTFRSLGYPAASPFNGQTMYYADSVLGVLDTNGGTNNPATMGIGSDATGGTSGGPWVYGWGAQNQLVSVNSYKYSTQPNALYGPQFDATWDTTRAQAVAITPP